MGLVREIVHLRAKVEYYRAELRRLHNEQT